MGKVFHFWFVFSIFVIIIISPPLFALKPAPQEEISEILKESNKSVVSILTFDSKKKELGEGKGVIVSSDGMVLTNYHLVSQAFSAKARLTAGQIRQKVEWEDVFYPGFETAKAAKEKKKKAKGKLVDVEGIVDVDKKLDLALIKIKGKGYTAAQLSSSDAFQIGDKTLIVVDDESISEGSIISLNDLSSDKKIMQISLYLASTMSGSPVFNMQGEVIAFTTYLADKANTIIPVSYGTPLIKEGKATPLSKYAHEDFFKVSEGLFLKGLAHSITDNFGQAINLMEESSRLNAQDPDVFARLGFSYSQLNQYERATGAYQNALNLNPNDYKSAYGLGIAYLRLNQFQQAVAPLVQCTKINPEFPDAFYNLGFVYERLEQLAKAAEAYERFVKINPGPAWTGLNQLGSIYMKLGQYEQAIVAFQEVLGTQPENLKANYNLAYAYDMSGQFDQAASYYRKLVSLNPEDAKAYYGLLFRLYDKAGDYAKAVEVGKEIINQTPDDPQSQYNLGIIYMKKQDFPNALSSFNQALYLNPDFEQVYYNIGLLHFRQKKYADSIDAFSKFTEFQPENADAFHNIGISYLQLKKYEKALKPLQRAIELRPEYEYAHYHLGICYFVLKDRFSANEEYKILKKFNPELAAKLLNLINK